MQTPKRTALAALLLLAFAGSAAAQAVKDGVILPNANLQAEGIPPIPAAIADKAAKYNDFRARSFVEWHPVRREMLLSTRTKGVGVQLHLLRAPLGELEQLTDFPDPVRRATFEPQNGAYLVFEKDTGGSEAAQLFRLDMITRTVTLLTEAKEKHRFSDWNHAGDTLLYVATPLDKTAEGGTRAEVTSDVWLMNPAAPEGKRKLASLPGGGWGNFKWSADDKTLLAQEYRSINDSTLWLIDVASGARKQLLPKPGAKLAEPVFHGNAEFSRDGKAVLFTHDQGGEFQTLARLDLKSGKVTPLSKHIAWDVSDIEAAAQSNKLAGIVNRDGLAELHLFDAATGREDKLPKVPAGGVSNVKWRDGAELGFKLNSAKSPGELYSLDTKTGAVEQWTTPAPTSMDTAAFPEQQIVRWKSFDGRMISGLLTKPVVAAAAGKKFPVVINIHGGPESQATIGFLGKNNYLINEMGLAYLQPNVRGSSGFGKSFLKLDNGFKREDSVKDIGALLDWIAQQPDLDAARVVIQGGSYGGYMTLAAATHYSDRVAGFIDTVGISHFTTFLERTESYRRDLRRVEYGDERDAAMRAFFDKIAPLNNAQKISKPLFVVQGKNDPRVPLNEAEQIVAKVRQGNTPVWYLAADNEGHGFARKPNMDFYFYAQIQFYQTYLLKN